MIISVAFCAILFTVGRVISHRIAGPLYAFERFLMDALEGKDVHLKLRTGDEFRHLEELANEINDRLHDLKKERTIQVVDYSDTSEK